MIGRSLYPLMTAAGFDRVDVSPRMVYVDSSRPQLVEGFTRRTFTAMVDILETWRPTAGLTCTIAAHGSRDSV